VPNNYRPHRILSYSGISDADALVLNKDVFCHVPPRRCPLSPEDYNGPKICRNGYEDALVRVEEERYELDMAIERNHSTMKQLEPLAEEALALKNGEERDGQPIGRLQYKLKQRSLNAIHVGAIARVYGDRGDEVVQHLLRHPLVVLPIVYNRLREKHIEWKNARGMLLGMWRGVAEVNYEGSFDTLCYFYKKEVERSFSTDHLIEECKRARHYIKHPRKQNDHPASRLLNCTFSTTSPAPMIYQPHIYHSLPSSHHHNHQVHKDAYTTLCLLLFGGIAKTASDCEKVVRIWTEFMVPWFNLPSCWFLKQMRERGRRDKSSCVVKFAVGQSVRTAYGDGQVISLLEGTNTLPLRYEIEFLHSGIGYLRPSAILHALPSKTAAQFARRGGFMQFVETPPEIEKGQVPLEGRGYKTMFVTEKCYLFLRLYGLLIRVLNMARWEILEPKRERGRPKCGVATMRNAYQRPSFLPSSSEGDRPMEILSPFVFTGYHGLISALQNYIKEDLATKQYETICRTLHPGKTHVFAALPRLLEKTAESMVKMAKEDVCLVLHDLSILKNMDLKGLREDSLNVANDASYRVEYDGESIFFGYLGRDTEMLLSPKESSSGSSSRRERGEQREREEADEEGSERELMPLKAPPSKRIKLKL